MNSQANSYMFSKSDSGVSCNDGDRGVHRGGHRGGQSWRIIVVVIKPTVLLEAYIGEN